MSMDAKVNLRTRKLGILIKDARMVKNKSLEECALALGITTEVFQEYEEGSMAPSLPVLEIFAYYLNLPLEHFWRNDVVSEKASPLGSIDIPALVGIRQRMIGTLLCKQRMESGTSLEFLSEQSGILTSMLSEYELGDSPIPVPVLEELMSILNGSIEIMYDKSGPVGKWLNENKAIQIFLQLSPELQSFISNPVNQPYLELALTISGLSPARLRSIAESLLEITL